MTHEPERNYNHTAEMDEELTSWLLNTDVRKWPTLYNSEDPDDTLNSGYYTSG